MITVRFPNGQAVTYNSGARIDKWSNGTNIKTREDGLLAWVSDSSGAIIEWSTPCKVENPIANVTWAEALKVVAQNCREFDHWQDLELLASLKDKLRKFNRQQKRWMK